MLKSTRFWRDEELSGSFQEHYTRTTPSGSQGHTDSRVHCRPAAQAAIIDCVQSSNFISWFLTNRTAPAALTCETVNKSSKSSKCYIDSDKTSSRCPAAIACFCFPRNAPGNLARFGQGNIGNCLHGSAERSLCCSAGPCFFVCRVVKKRWNG